MGGLYKLCVDSKSYNIDHTKTFNYLIKKFNLDKKLLIEKFKKEFGDNNICLV